MAKNPNGSKLRAEIHTSGPVGSWARLAPLLTSLSELYIVFERVWMCRRLGVMGGEMLMWLQALLSEPMVVLADDPRTASEFVSSVVDMIRPVGFRVRC